MALRITRATFDLIVMTLSADLLAIPGSPGKPRISPAKQVALTCWFLATGETQRGVGDRFGVGATTAGRIISRVCRLLSSTFKYDFAYPEDPEDPEWAEIIADFFAQSGFPNCIGAVDGSHVPIRQPSVEFPKVRCGKGLGQRFLQF